MKSQRPRPDWKPGAALKTLVHKYRHIRGSGDIILKKKRAMKAKPKQKDVKKPTLVISKKDGEFKVQMEVQRKYSKDRLHFQYPYEDLPRFVYQVGRTDEQNAKRKAKRERRERREQKRKTKFLQSTFKNMCEDICVKAYKQAIGISPTPNPNDPDCPCYPDNPDVISLSLQSCSCDESSTSEDSSDGNEWQIEFTPPTDRFDPEAARPPHIKENDCQYNYLDFRIKLVDKLGNPVPRFFIGPDGKEVCSDLGGFWGPDGKWLEIGTDGYVGSDNRWVPMAFLGPDGTWINAEEGTFVDGFGRTLTIGVDGCIGADGKWVYYPPGPKQPKRLAAQLSAISDASLWTCLPHVTPSFLATRNIVPHGRDRSKMKSRIDAAIAAGNDIKMPKPQHVPRFRQGKLQPIESPANMKVHVTNESVAIKRPTEMHPSSQNRAVISVPPTAGSGQPKYVTGKKVPMTKWDDGKIALSTPVSGKLASGRQAGGQGHGGPRTQSGQGGQGSRGGQGGQGSRGGQGGQRGPGDLGGQGGRGGNIGQGGRGGNSGQRGHGGQGGHSGHGGRGGQEGHSHSHDGKDATWNRPIRSAEEQAAHQEAFEKLKKGSGRDVCALARMRKEGVKFAKGRRDCLKDVVGDCCVLDGGLCQDIFID